MILKRAPLPQLLVCPKCHNAERTVACRFCGISKLKPYDPLPVVDVPMIVDPGFESDLGCVKVGFRSRFKAAGIRVVAVIAPPDPEVGLFDPYPIEVSAVDDDGLPVTLDYREARFLISAVADQIF